MCVIGIGEKIRAALQRVFSDRLEDMQHFNKVFSKTLLRIHGNF